MLVLKLYDGVIADIVLHGDLARHFLPLGFSVVGFHEEIILAQVLLHSQVFCDACRDARWRDELKHFLELFLLLLLLQLQGHFVLILGFDHELLVPLDPIESGDFPRLVPLFDDFFDSWIARSHLIPHPDDILRRLVALVPLFSILLSILFIAYLHLADFDGRASKHTSLGVPAHFTNFTESAALSNGVYIACLPPNLILSSLHGQGQAQVFHHICALLVPFEHHGGLCCAETSLWHRHRFHCLRSVIHSGKLLAWAEIRFNRSKFVAAERLAQLVPLLIPSGDLLRFIRVLANLLFRLVLHKLRSAAMWVGFWRESQIFFIWRPGLGLAALVYHLPFFIITAKLKCNMKF